MSWLSLERAKQESEISNSTGVRYCIKTDNSSLLSAFIHEYITGRFAIYVYDEAHYAA